MSNLPNNTLKKLEILIPRGQLTDEDGAKYNNDVIWSLINTYGDTRELEGREAEAKHHKDYWQKELDALDELDEDTSLYGGSERVKTIRVMINTYAHRLIELKALKEKTHE